MTLIVLLLPVVLCLTLKSKIVTGFSIPKATNSPTLPKNDIRLSAIAVEYTPEERKSGNRTDEIGVVKNNDDGNDDDDDDNGWDLREDWALQDAVPRYTVGRTMISSEASTSGATFWTQLRHSTPALATNTEKDLKERYSLLQQRQKQQFEKSSAANDIPKLIQSGASPTLLSDWWVSSPSSSSIASPTSMTSTTMMSGILESGSKIWFPLQCAGTIGDQPTSTTTANTGTIIPSDIISQDALDDFFISSSMTLHTSSYAISIGGMVYELGKPQRQQQQQIIIGESRDSNNNIGTRNSDVGDHDNIILINHLKKMTTSIITKNAGMVFSIIAASTISACITAGYVTAIKTTADYTTLHNNANQKQIVAITKSSSSPSSSKYARVTTENRVTVPEYTVSEQRARQELRVGRDKRHMVLLQDRLERDEVKLTELRQEESRLEVE